MALLVGVDIETNARRETGRYVLDSYQRDAHSRAAAWSFGGLLKGMPVRDFGTKRSPMSDRDEHVTAAGPGPGKRILTEMLLAPAQQKSDAVVHRKADSAPAMPTAPRPSIAELFGRRTEQQPSAGRGLDDAPRPPIMRSEAGPASGDPGELFGAATHGAGSEVPYRAEMEHSFGEDFAGVRVHLGQTQAMRGLGAHAAAQGENVAFATTDPTKELVAHELTHVVQHRRGALSHIASKAVSSPSDASEIEADAVASKVAAGERVQVGRGRAGATEACACAGAGCAACDKVAGSSGSSTVARSIVHRAAAPGSSRAAIDEAISLVAGPALEAARTTGGPMAIAERVAVVNQAHARLSQPAGEAEQSGAGQDHNVNADQLIAAVNQLRTGFAHRSSGAPQQSEGGDAAERQTATGPRARSEPAHRPEAMPAAAAGVVQRQVAPPPFDCEGLLQQIIEFLNVVKQRSAELIADVQGLQWNHWAKGDAHPDYGSVEGHQDQFRDRQRGLRRRLNDWNSNNCGGGLPADAWDWATQPAPNPTPRPNPAVQRATETVAVGVGVGVGLYVAYRVVRMIPSLFPPLWWTIPGNAAIP